MFQRVVVVMFVVSWLLACGHQAVTPSAPENAPPARKTYTGTDAFERYTRDQAAQAEQERRQRCIDARAALAKAQADNDSKQLALLQASAKDACEGP
jgi:hypothetical protein